MNEELLAELKSLAKEYDVSNRSFNEIFKNALVFKEFSGLPVSDEQLFEIVKESIQNFDHNYAPMGDTGKKRKTIKSTVELVASKLMGNVNEDLNIDISKLYR